MPSWCLAVPYKSRCQAGAWRTIQKQLPSWCLAYHTKAVAKLVLGVP
ncbi:hypothetical protein [Lentisphaera araneosa]|nr:hypothetical protein [Lentisphaera araneosa]